jgi:hypothetical protein
MLHGMHNAIDLHRVENEVRERDRRYHYLMVDLRMRNRKPSWLSHLSESVRALFSPRPVMREERGV